MNHRSWPMAHFSVDSVLLARSFCQAVLYVMCNWSFSEALALGGVENAGDHSFGVQACRSSPEGVPNETAHMNVCACGMERSGAHWCLPVGASDPTANIQFFVVFDYF